MSDKRVWVAMAENTEEPSIIAAGSLEAVTTACVRDAHSFVDDYHDPEDLKLALGEEHPVSAWNEVMNERDEKYYVYYHVQKVPYLD